MIEKAVFWMGSSLDDLKEFPREVQDQMGYALYIAQIGGKHPSVKPLKGFSGASVLEIVDDYQGDTFRTVYTVKLAEAIYVLHAFQKKSKTGISTPKRDLDLIQARLKTAIDHSKQWRQV